MNKHVIIVIVASIVISGTLGFSFWNIHAAEQIQFRATGEQFSFFDLVNDGEIIICNPLPMYTNFNKMNVVIIYEGKEKGTFSTQGIVLEPNSATSIQGKFSSETFEEAQYLAMHFDGMFSGSTPVRIDPKKMDIATEFTTQIVGFIPISISNQYSGIEFWDMMNSNLNNC